MTRRELLDRLMSMRDNGEDMGLPLLVRLDGPGRPAYGHLVNVCNGSYGLSNTGIWAGLMIANKVKM